MKVLVTGHNGFIGRNVFLDWQQTLGYVNVDGIDYPDDIGDFSGGDYDLVIHLAAYADIRESLKNQNFIMKIMSLKQRSCLSGVERQTQDFYMPLQAQQKKITGRIHML